ncbi:MAG: efflux RND transporter periplasmic adaptor subunit [Bryobacteraceae bacterium]|nr:efflux RND transporter periplasmic adaptor subunit [Bryobacteraceae bacterium]
MRVNPLFISFCCAASFAFAQTKVETVEVTSDKVSRNLKLPGEFLPYLTVDLHARVAGFVENVRVDRGSSVRVGDLLVTLSAPEMKAQILEAEARVRSAEADLIEQDAKIAAAMSTFERLKAASATPGAIAGNELIQAEKSVDAVKAAKQGLQMRVQAAKAAAEAQKELQGYLQVTAPFDGIITERFAHPGALAGPSSPTPLLRLEQVSRLRLVVAVPESEVGGMVRNARVPFSVPAYPGQTFQGTVARIGRVLDPKTRTMPVELDVMNGAGKLSPGMFPEVTWPVRMTTASTLVPPTAVVTNTARTFVIRVRAGKAEWVTVRRGKPAGDLLEVAGDVAPGDRVVKAATDEIRDGAPVTVKAAAKK